MRNNKILLCCLAAALLLMTTVVMAQAPNTISYQGRLADDAGDAITTQVSVTFAIYAAASGGSALYTQTLNVTPDQNGVFTVQLGPIGGTVFDGSLRYMGIKVGADAEMTPRQALTSAPYSFNTNNIADNSITTAKIAAGEVGNSDLANNAVNGAKVADGGLSSVDISNEPGVNAAYGSASTIVLTAADTNLATVTINAPTAGYVVVVASAYYQPNHVTGTKDLGRFCISRTSSLLDYVYMANVSTPASATTDSDMPLPVSLHRFDAVSAGTNTFYFVADAYTGAPRVSKARMAVMFFPTAYGTIVPPAANPVNPDAPTQESSRVTDSGNSAGE